MTKAPEAQPVVTVDTANAIHFDGDASQLEEALKRAMRRRSLSRRLKAAWRGLVR